MSRTGQQVSDDAAGESGRERSDDVVRINRSIPVERWRYRCPNGHTDFHPTNSHVLCKGCRRANEAGEDVDPEHYEIIDQKTGETIPWSAVELVAPEEVRRPNV